MTFFYILMALLAVTLLIVAMLRRSYNIEHAVIIRNELEVVRDKVADLNYFASWSPFKLNNDKAVVEISGHPKTAGHACSWKDRKTGKGNITIRAIDDKHVHFDLFFTYLVKMESKDNWFFEEWGDSETKVTWQKNGRLSFPFAKLVSNLVIKSLHGEIRSGLANLKILCERVV